MTSCLRISRDAPCLDGHFPDHPIVPAVVILDAVLAEAARRCAPARRPLGIASCKFMDRLLPEQDCHIEFGPEDGDRLAFRCTEGDRVLAQGKLLLGGDAPA